MKTRDEWYNGQGKFDIANFIKAERNNFGWYHTDYDAETGERKLKIRGAAITEGGMVSIYKTVEGTLSDNAAVPSKVFGVELMSTAKVTPVLTLRDPLTSVETRTSMFAPNRMSGLLVYDPDVAKLYNVERHWSESKWDMNNNAKFISASNSGWGTPNGFFYISEADRPYLNKFWSTLQKSAKTLDHLNVKKSVTHRHVDYRQGLLADKSPEQLAQLTEEDVLADMMSDAGVTYTLATRGKKEFTSYFATHSDTRYMEVI